MLDYWVNCLVEAGISEARINTHAHVGRVREHIRSVNSAGWLRLAESYEPELLGSAGTVAANVDLAEGADEIVIIYADNLSDIDLRPLLAFHRQHGDVWRPAPLLKRLAENGRTFAQFGKEEGAAV